MYNNQIEQKISRDHLIELQHVLEIISSAKSVRRRTIKGVQYHIARYTDAFGNDMHFIFGGGSWTTAPADRQMKE